MKKNDNLTALEQEKLLNLLECDQNELVNIYDNADEAFNQTDTIYDALLKILQQGNNVREAALTGILCGRMIGFLEAKDKIEIDIKEKLFNAFKNNRSF